MNSPFVLFCKKIISCLTAAFLAVPLYGQSPQKTWEMPEVVVESDLVEKLQKKGRLKSCIIKTEVITEDDILSKRANTLADAIENEPGIDAVTGCSMCGMRRVQINGLKGEYTTVLMDGVPVNSTVFGYYGFGALSTAGLGRVEIARGSGASLIAPEAIGGVINIVTKKPKSNSIFFDAAVGDHDYKNMSFVGSGVTSDGKGRVLAAAQASRRGQWDQDGNGVNENPRVESLSASLNISRDLGDNNNLDLRLAVFDSETFGGPTEDSLFYTINRNEGLGPLFQDGDVRKQYIGDPFETYEHINTDRQEGTLRWTALLPGNINLVTTLAAARQVQDSYYEAGDYYHLNKYHYGDTKLNIPAGDNHFVTAGVSARQESLRAQSYAFFDVLGRTKDDYGMSSMGAYLQDVWQAHPKLEISGAVRFDNMAVDFKGLTGKQDEIDDSVVMPRLHIKWTHAKGLVSRISGGMGYRAPLTFFESDHGLIEDGFAVNVTELEKSQSAGYALSLDTPRLTSTVSYNHTTVKDMAYINTDDFAIPTLVTYNENVNVQTIDGVIGYQVLPSLNIAAGYEHFVFSDKYKGLMAIASVEDRARLMVNFGKNKWDIDSTLTWIGSRDLKPYGYTDSFNVWDGTTASDPKESNAPAYATVDLKISRAIGKDTKLYIGAKNLFDYHQADKESPLFYDDAGGYDVGHIWGPLRGREIYAGMQMRFQP